jgi:hypothetical protein
LIDESGAFQGQAPTLFQDQQVLYTVRFVAQTPLTGVGTLIFDAKPANNLPLNETTLIKPDPGVVVTPAQISYVDSTPITVLAAAGEGEFTNPNNPYDVNDDGYVSPFDLLVLINYLNENGSTVLQGSQGGEGEASKKLYLDVNSDMMITPLDLLSEINYLNALSGIGGQGEGEGSVTSGAIAGPVAAADERLNPASVTVAAMLPEEPVSSASSVDPAQPETSDDNNQSTDRTVWDDAADAVLTLELKLSDELAEDVFAAWGEGDLDELAVDLL